MDQAVLQAQYCRTSGAGHFPGRSEKTAVADIPLFRPCLGEQFEKFLIYFEYVKITGNEREPVPSRVYEVSEKGIPYLCTFSLKVCVGIFCRHHNDSIQRLLRIKIIPAYSLSIAENKVGENRKDEGCRYEVQETEQKNGEADGARLSIFQKNCSGVTFLLFWLLVSF
jgi:hypothetical protein